jgi:hypothetical protein
MLRVDILHGTYGAHDRHSFHNHSQVWIHTDIMITLIRIKERNIIAKIKTTILNMIIHADTQFPDIAHTEHATIGILAVGRR